MNELCISTNLTSTELAAWVQAVGSIVAILAAIAIAQRQDWTERWRRKLDAVESMNREVNTCRAFGIQLLAVLTEMISVLRRQAGDRIYVQKALLAELARWPDQISIDHLPVGAIFPFLNIRAIAAEADALGRLMQEPIDYGHWDLQFDSLRERVDMEFKTMSAEFMDAVTKKVNEPGLG